VGIEDKELFTATVVDHSAGAEAAPEGSANQGHIAVCICIIDALDLIAEITAVSGNGESLAVSVTVKVIIEPI